MSLEELMSLEVTSVSKKPQRRGDVAAALFVLTHEDLRRSGARNIPDALRLVPGAHVAQIDANKWAVGLRGFGGRFSNKLLVLRDGRTLYTPLFAGVFWDVQDVLLEDVERIEVVRGPGGTLWGANAMNGVINVITRSARETHGAWVEGGGGSEERGFGAFRYGAGVGEDFHVRLFGSFFDRDGGFVADGPAGDDWRLGRMGFRIDGDPGPDDQVTLHGEVYQGEVGQPGLGTPSTDDEVQGGYVLGRYVRRVATDSEWALQTFYDHTDRNDPFFRERRGTFDLDLQHRFPLFQAQELVWGVQYRLTSDEFRGGPLIDLAPDGRDVQFVSGFVQDELKLFDGSLRLVGGTKVESNDFTGLEVQPSGRIAWSPLPESTLWASVSRAVRVPSRVENDLRIDVPASLSGGVGQRFLGNRDLEAEDLLAWELGLRLIPAEWLAVDLAGFRSDYDDVLDLRAGAPVPDGRGGILVPAVFGNGLEGEIHGIELALDLAPTDVWRLRGTYSWLDTDIDPEPGAMDPQMAAGSSPRHLASLHALFDLPGGFELDAVARAVDRLPAQAVDSYVTFDLRLARALPRGFEVVVVGRNLAEARHREFSGGTQVERGVYALLRWRTR